MKFSAYSARQRGSVLIYSTIAIVALFGIASLVVDFSRAQLVKTEMRRAVDAAARYGAKGLGDNTYVAKAQSAASANTSDTSSVTLSSSDIEKGNWNTSSYTFTANGTPTNAIRITTTRVVPTVFAQVVGFSGTTVHVQSVATYSSGTPSGFIGLDSVTVKNNLLTRGYDSNITTTPTSSTATLDGMLGSNGAITAKNNESVGYTVLGPSGSHNLDLTTPATVLAADIPTPAINFSAAPATNPGSVSQTLSVSGTTTLNAGTYYFTSISLANNATLTFNGAATVYVSGDVTFAQNGAILAYGRKPSNLVIRQKGVGSTFGGTNANSVEIVGDLEGPQSALAAKNSLTIYGRAVFKSIDAKNGADLYYDTNLTSTLSGTSTSVKTVK